MPRVVRPRARLAVLLAVLSTLLLLVVPGPVAFAGARAPNATAPQPVGAPVAPSTPASGIARPTTGPLPGSDPSGEAAIDVPALVLAQLRAGLPGSLPAASGAAATGGGVRSSPREPASPAPAAFASSWVRGWVIDSTNGRGVPNASVTVAPVSGPCAGGCATNLTDSGGVFNVSIAPGAVEITVQDPEYLTNRTWTTVPAGTSVYVGRIFLVHDGYVTGVLRSFGPGHAAVAGIGVSVSSLDGLILASPGGTTGPNGSFTVPAPPLPSIVTFSPPPSLPAFVSNTTFANATPYGTVDVGTVYLEGGFFVNATLVDRSTGLPIPGAIPNQLWLCTDREPGSCRPGPLQNGSVATAYGIAGPAHVEAMALGYVVNVTSVPDVPSTAPNRTVGLGTIYLTPMGSFEVTSNFTGGTPPNSTWANGTLRAVACSLDGIEVATFPPYATPSPALVPNTCWGDTFVPNGTLANNAYAIGVTSRLLGPPLVDLVFLQPSTGFPVALATVPGSRDVTVLPQQGANFTWLNLTPGRLTLAGSFDVTPGRLVTGHVDVEGTTSPPSGGFSVTACSTDSTWVCASGSATAGCLSGNDTFCVAAPPGPIRLLVSAYNAGENRTWISIPRGCCGQEGSAIDVGRIFVPALGSTGTVNGTVVLQGAAPGVDLATVESCVVSPTFVASSTGVAPCVDAAVNATTGAFSLTTATGWNRVRAFAGGYEANWTWVDVLGANTSGTIELAPDGYLAGQVETPQGHGIYAAFVQACLLGAPTDCVAVGDGGLTSTDGQYYGGVPGFPFPLGAYEVRASASGYSTNWVWANVSSGALVSPPAIVLYPLGVNASPRPSPSAPTGGAGGWVDGRIVDGRTGLGISGVVPIACPVNGISCTSAGIPTSFGGEFNLSLGPGQYHLYLNATDHAPSLAFANLTSAGVVHLGTLTAAPFPFVVGRIDVGPWRSLTEQGGLGPSMGRVRVCDSRALVCGSTGALATDGTFNVSAPSGSGDVLQVEGNGVNDLSSPGYGFDLFSTFINVTGSSLSLPIWGSGVLVLDLFAVVSGRVRDGSLSNGAGPGAGPVPFASVTVHSNSAQASTTFQIADGGGRFVALLPTDGTWTEANASSSSFWGANSTATGTALPAGALALPNLTLPHFGWVALFVKDRSGSGLPGIPVQVSFPDPANGTVVLTRERTNGVGFVNITAPPMATDLLATMSEFYVNQSRLVSVAPSRTTLPSSLTLDAASGANGTWIQSAQVNTVGHPPVRTVVDNHTGAAVYGALVAVTGGSNGASGGPAVFTNGLGQFLTLAGAGAPAQLTLTSTSFATFAMSVNLSAGARAIVPRINLTADGVVAGRVVVEPGARPVANVVVAVCPVTFPGCARFALTNASGGFWVDAAPGANVVSVVTDSYLANVTLGTSVPSDGFVEVGDLPVYAFADVSGTVLGLPTGRPVAGANVSVCSPLGTPTGPCFAWISTDSNGSFTLYAPPATFVYRFSAPGFNTTYRELGPSPGASVDLGTVFLFADGLVIGSVVAAPNDTPIAGASLLACSLWIPGSCLAPVDTNASGGYLLTLPPGSISVYVSAPGFLGNFTSVTSESGAATIAPPIVLTPYEVAIPVAVRGNVTAAPDGSPIGGATVTGFYNGLGVAATLTGSDGAFALELFRGALTLSVSAPGFRTVQRALLLTGNVSDERFELSPMTYRFAGHVSDGTTGLGVAGVAIEEGNLSLAVTDSGGGFSVALPNGSYLLDLAPPGGSPFRDLAFGITINGGPVSRDFALVQIAVRVTVHVESGASGLPIAGALVEVVGNGSSTGAAVGGTTDLTGNFSVMLAPGNYLLDVLASGFPEYVGGLSVGAVPSTRVVPMGGTGGATAVPPGAGVLPYLVVGMAAVGAGALLLWARRGGRPPFARARGREPPAEDRTVEWRLLEP